MVELADLESQVALLSQEVADLSVVPSVRDRARSQPLMFPTLGDWVDLYFVPVFVGRLVASSAGARSGGSTPRRANDSMRSGDPGRRCGANSPPGWLPG